jgi:lipopolysaccharide transport system permease protein
MSAILTPPELPCPRMEARSLASNRSSSAANLPLVVIERRSGWQLVNFGELWRHRELAWFLIWRDVKVRYKHTVLGAAWAVLQPLGIMLVLTLFLGRLAASPEAQHPYALFVLAGLLPWTFFANAVNSASQSLILSPNLVTKVYFPRLLLPLAAVGTHLLDFALTFGLLLAFVLACGIVPTPGTLWLILIVGLLLVAALGVGALLAALNVAYRDVRYVLPFLLQLWLFATPAIYVSRPEAAGLGRGWLQLNPLHGLIENFRHALLQQPLDFASLAVSGSISVLLLLAGCHYFRRVERGFADLL